MINATTINEPAILTANTYFWTPGLSADQRRRSEVKRIMEVKSYLEALGFTTQRQGDSVSATHAAGIEVAFCYRESCKNVYKSLSITRGGKRSNVTAIRKLAA